MNTATGRGAFLLSLDTELAWGGVYNGSWRRRTHLFQGTRSAIGELLALLERYDIHATWAVVGHLFLDTCSKAGAEKHPEILRPASRRGDSDWFQDDPSTGWKEAPFWYAPDIVTRVLACRATQEVGCHGFSHMIAGDPGFTRECMESELDAAHTAANRWGVKLESFVFPRNSVAHLDALRSRGYIAFRGVAHEWTHRLPSGLSRLGHVAQAFAPVPPPTATPRFVDGLWDIPGTYLYVGREGWGRHLPISLRVSKARQGLRLAIDRKAVFHMWFHPFNLASDPEGLLKGLDLIFQEVASLRERGLLSNPTMGEMARSLSYTASERMTRA